jgi:beta-glucosidase
MNKLFLYVASSIVLAFGVQFGGCHQGAPSVLVPTTIDYDAWPELKSPVERDPDVETRIDELLVEMSLEQKVGQMIQAEIRWVEPDDVRDYHLGSVLNGGGGYPGENKYSSVGDWVELADAFYEASMDTGYGRLAIPVLWGTDSVHGVGNVYGATLFPHNIGLGAMRNPVLVSRIGEVTALETAVTGIPWTFAPTLAVVRDDRWGRTYEGYSEDPEIVRLYSAALVMGLQGELGRSDHLDDSHVLATAKHFLGDGGTHNGVDQGNNLAEETELFAIHGQGYVTALEAGVRTIMASYSSSRGLKMHGNRYLLTEILKERMGFDGFIVGDWDGHDQIPGCSKKSCAAAINAGIDLIMVPKYWKPFLKNTLRDVKRGDISMARVDDAVRRILRVKFEAGLFEAGAPSSRQYAGKAEFLGSAENRAVARQAVRESLVLLKNNGGVLPLDRDLDVLVAGIGASDVSRQSGGWSLTWQGTDNDNDDFPGATTIFQGIDEAVSTAGGTATLSSDGSYIDTPDIAIVVWGEPPYSECFGDRKHLNYNAQDPDSLALLEKLNANGIPVVSVFLSGRPLWVNPHINASNAFVAAWLPGTEGDGVAEVLFKTAAGEINHDFKGKLSFSWPNTLQQNVLNVGDDNYDALFPYGFGLNYEDQHELTDELTTEIGDTYLEYKAVPVGYSCVD